MAQLGIDCCIYNKHKILHFKNLPKVLSRLIRNVPILEFLGVEISAILSELKQEFQG